MGTVIIAQIASTQGYIAYGDIYREIVAQRQLIMERSEMDGSFVIPE